MTGGFNLDSTEVLEDMAGTWRLTAPLPSARNKLRAASVENSIFVFGENILYYINIEHFILLYMLIMAIYLQAEKTITEIL